MQTHTDLKMSGPMIMFTTSMCMSSTGSHRCCMRKVMTRLLTLVQVGDCWKYALEAIIKMLLSYFLFMIKFIIHARIVLTGNISTCVFNRQNRSP